MGGASPEQQQLISCFISKYGDPRYATKPAFKSLIVTTNIVNNTPVDRVVKFNKNIDRIYYWTFYEGVNKDDEILMLMAYYSISRTAPEFVALKSQKAGGRFGAVTGSISKPTKGWVTGEYAINLEIIDSPNNVTALSQTPFEIIDGDTQTKPLPCQEVQEGPTERPVNVASPPPHEEIDKAKSLQKPVVGTSG